MVGKELEVVRISGARRVHDFASFKRSYSVNVRIQDTSFII